MSDEKALVPVEQKTVAFYEDQVTAVRLNHLCTQPDSMAGIRADIGDAAA